MANEWGAEEEKGVSLEDDFLAADETNGKQQRRSPSRRRPAGHEGHKIPCMDWREEEREKEKNK